MRPRLLPIVLLLGMNTVPAAESAVNPLARLSFLLGEWRSSSPPGTETFRSTLEGRSIVRTSTADATGAHEPMQSTVTFFCDIDGVVRALYLDNEGHVVRYRRDPSPPGTARFVSENADDAVRFRLTYAAIDAQHIAVTFEMADAAPAEFHTVAGATEFRSATKEDRHGNDR
jgi:hypothetical protein